MLLGGIARMLYKNVAAIAVAQLRIANANAIAPRKI